MVLWNVHFPNSLINIGQLIHRFDNSIILKMITRERPVKREIVEKEIRKEKKIKRIPLKRIKAKIRSRIKNNLMDLTKKRFFTLIISLPDFARRVSTINI